MTGSLKVGRGTLIARTACFLAAVVLLDTQAGGATAGASPSSTGPTGPTGPSSSSPRTGKPKPKPASERRTTLTGLPPAQRTNGTWALRVRLSGPVAPGSPEPRLHPEPPGHWTRIGKDEFFNPDVTLEACAKYVLWIPPGTRARDERPLGKARQIDLQVSCPSTQALQQALSVLGYLPYSVRLEGQHPKRVSRYRAAAERAFVPSGRLVAHVKGAPGLDYGTLDGTTEAALEVYEEDNGVSSEPGALWRSLLEAQARERRDPHPYTFITVSEGDPETLEVHQGSKVVLSSPTNTGVAGAETPTGEFPIYARYESTEMKGTDPDGVSYDVPDVPWVNYFNGGDAVHGYERSSYGWPQSNGCVELPVETARRIFGMLQIGDLVLISG